MKTKYHKYRKYNTIWVKLITTVIFILLMTFAYSCKNDDKEKLMDDNIKTKAVSYVIHSRKSVRSFTDKKVGEEDLEQLVRAGMAAPTGKNLQPWVFYVITNKQILEHLGDELPTAQMLGSVYSAIMVCGDISKADTTTYMNYWVMDCSAASENILLAAESMGLGACWTAVFPYDGRISTIRKFIKLPDNHIPLNIIPVGYPTGEESPKDKWKPENMIKIE